jgi:hypothetical protein
MKQTVLLSTLRTEILAIDCRSAIDYMAEDLRVQASPERRHDNETTCRGPRPTHCGSSKHAVGAE